MFTVSFVAENSKRITLKDVARDAGVSHMTASRVVRGIGGVKKDTVARVKASVARLGYKPDPALSALANYRSHGGGQGDGSVLAFLDCDQTEFSRQVCHGAQNEAQRHGYLVERIPMPTNEREQKQLNRQLYHRGVRGLLFGPSDAEWVFEHWNWPEYAAVSLGALSHKPAMHAVASDYFYTAYSGCRLLRSEGAQRIGFAVDRRLEARTGHRWLGGYSAALDGQSGFVYSGQLDNFSQFQAWQRRHRLDGLLTLHREFIERFRGARDKALMLNSQPLNQFSGMRRLELDPQLIGQEGVRVLHHLLLRREYGLPEAPHMTALRGVWKD